MKLHQTIQIVKEICALRHFSFKTEKTYLHWIGRYASFLKENPNQAPLTPEKKMETFLTRLAFSGMSGGTQNQAFNALRFLYREVLKKELGPVDALRAKRTGTVRQAPSQAEVANSFVPWLIFTDTPRASSCTCSTAVDCASVNH